MRLAFSNSFVDSDFKLKVVCFLVWLELASILTLCLAMTCFMISPRVVGFPSLPAVERSIEVRVKLSVTRLEPTTAGAMRGPLLAPQADVVCLIAGATVGASEGKATSDPVSRGALAGFLAGLGAAGPLSTKEGKGSGAPSSSCLFYNHHEDITEVNKKCVHEECLQTTHTWRSAAEKADMLGSCTDGPLTGINQNQKKSLHTLQVCRQRCLWKS